MVSSFSSALSGMTSDTTAINAISNDLANLNTTGYKSTDVQFSDLMAQSLGATGTGQIGDGIGSVHVNSDYSQGTLQVTNGATDAAIQGNGFFTVKDSNNQTLYTRDGSFQVNSSGQLVTATGETVQGWTATNGAVNPNSPVGNITLPLGASVAPTSTTSMSLALNLDSRVATTDPGAVVTAPIQVFDSQGSSHTLTATFTKTANNSWGYSVSIPAADLPTGGTTTLASGTLTFDSNGNLTSPAATAPPVAVSIPALADGSAAMNIKWNLYNTAGTPQLTQLAESSSVSASNQNGFGAGQVTKLSLQNGGTVVANYSNGQQVTVGQLALSSISNPDSLVSAGNNNFAASAATATPVTGAANSGSLGQIVAGSLESSTVDIAKEFTQLLTFQRGYQADSRVITTTDQLLQETVNLIHP